jgi:hypothetical protein
MKRPGHKMALSLFLGVLILWLAAMAVIMRHAALPPEATGPMLAIFEPGTPEDEVFASLARADARIVRPGGLGFICVNAGAKTSHSAA